MSVVSACTQNIVIHYALNRQLYRANVCHFVVCT